MKPVSSIFVLAVLLFTSCATSQSNFRSLGGMSYPPRAENAPVEVFQDGLPDCAFERIARLDVHLEKTHFIGSDLNSALPQLMSQARAAGADAIIEIRELSSSLAETKIYHVTATGIRYTDADQ